MRAREMVLARLAELQIPYTITEHAAVFTIEEMARLALPWQEDVCKNLFLRDATGQRHFLVILPGAKQADLRAIRAQLGTSHLSFASAERLAHYLKLKQGEVTPFGLLNDTAKAVEAVLARSLLSRERLGLHPNENTATLWLSPADLLHFLQENGTMVHIIDC